MLDVRDCDFRGGASVWGGQMFYIGWAEVAATVPADRPIMPSSVLVDTTRRRAVKLLHARRSTDAFFPTVSAHQ